MWRRSRSHALPCAGSGGPEGGGSIRPTFTGTTGGETPPLARQPNYDFEKRKKEAERKAKKDAKLEERRRRKEEGGGSGEEEIFLPVDADGNPPA